MYLIPYFGKCWFEESGKIAWGRKKIIGFYHRTQKMNHRCTRHSNPFNTAVFMSYLKNFCCLWKNIKVSSLFFHRPLSFAWTPGRIFDKSCNYLFDLKKILRKFFSFNKLPDILGVFFLSQMCNCGFDASVQTYKPNKNVHIQRKLRSSWEVIISSRENFIYKIIWCQRKLMRLVKANISKNALGYVI